MPMRQLAGRRRLSRGLTRSQALSRKRPVCLTRTLTPPAALARSTLST